jgi:hypothetical protein
MKPQHILKITKSITWNAVKVIVIVFTITARMQNTARAIEYVYSCSATGPVDFTASVTLDYNQGFVTDRPQITITTDAPMGDGIYYFAGGTVTPASITRTGFELDYRQNYDGSQGFEDLGLVFDELIQVPKWNIVSVPEPSSCSMGLVALGVLGIWRKHEICAFRNKANRR